MPKNVSSKLRPIQSSHHPLKQNETTFIKKELEFLLQKEELFHLNQNGENISLQYLLGKNQMGATD